MTLTRRTIAIAAILLSLAGVERSTAAEQFLFIGNSFTRQWGVAEMVMHLLPDDTQRRVTDLSRDGATLYEHVFDGAGLAAINNGDWAGIVLQDFSDTALVRTKAERSGDAVAHLLGDATPPGAKLVMFAPWAPSRTPPAERAAATEVIEAHYRNLAERHGGVLAPVGRGWRLSLDRWPGIVLRASDDHHATEAGAYLAALIISMVMTGEREVTVWHPDGISRDEARKLRDVARRTLAPATAREVRAVVHQD